MDKSYNTSNGMLFLAFLLAGLLTANVAAAVVRSPQPTFVPQELTLTVPADVRPEIKRYLAMAKPRKRHAFITGISNYENAERLPSAKLDALSMHTLLRDELNFIVDERPLLDADVDQFWGRFENFLKRIDPGDVALVYFSGHGFSYRDNAYLAPRSFESCVLGEDVPFLFVSESEIRSRLAGKLPALGLAIFDACRTLKGPVAEAGLDVNHQCPRESGEKVIFTERGVTRLMKNGQMAREPSSLPEPIAVTEWNGYSLYASEKGSPAIGINDLGELSYFTEALKRNLAIPGLSLWELQKQVRYDVCRMTRTTDVNGQMACRQRPIIYPSSIVEIWLHEDEMSLKKQQESFINAMVNNIEAVEKFADFYKASPYATAAEKYLKDKREATTSHTRFPLTLGSKDCRALGINVPDNAFCAPRIDGPLSFSRTRALPKKAFTPSPMFSDDSAFGRPGTIPAATVASALTSYTSAVARVDKLALLIEPSPGAKPAGKLHWMDRVEVLDSVVTPDGEVFSKLRILRTNEIGFLRQQATKIKRALSIVPLSTFDLEFAATDRSSRLEETALINRLTTLRLSASGSVILKIEVSAQADSQQRIRMYERFNDAFRIALLAGYQRRAVTADKSADFTGLRIRFSVSQIDDVPVNAGKNQEGVGR